MIRYDFENSDPLHPVVLGIGVFDGVHLGHRLIMAAVTDLAHRTGATPVAVTFFPHPRAILAPATPPRLLLPPSERLARLRAAGAAGIGVIDFSAAIAATAPADFVELILASPPSIVGICVGEHWRFGCRGSGDTRFLAAELTRRGIAFNAVPELEIHGEVVSSSTIRDAVAAGNLAKAERMLGSPIKLYGQVESGFHEATEILAAPTANIRVEYGVYPPDGVYATWAEINGRRIPSVTNIGVSPTFDRQNSGRRMETHILGFSGDLYGQNITVELAARLRDEIRFPSPALLAKQIAEDCSNALRILTGGKNKK